MGFGPEEFSRCANLAWPTPPAAFAKAREGQEKSETNSDPDAERWQRMRTTIGSNPPMDIRGPRGVNSAAWRAAEFPSTNPHSNARSVATVFGRLADIMASGRGQPALPSADALKLATAIRSDGADLVVGRPTRFGLGFQLTQPDRPLGPNAETFGHYGNGGHLGFADPTVPLGFAYHMNLQGFAWRDPRNIALTDAVYASVG